MSKRLGGIIGCKDKKLFMAFKRVPRCFSHFSVLVANPKKIFFYRGRQSRSKSAEQGKKGGKKVSQRSPTVVTVQILLKFWYFICSVHTTAHYTSIDVFFQCLVGVQG